MRLRTKRVEEWIVIDGENPGEKAEFLVHPLTPKETTALLAKAKQTEWEKGQRFAEVDFYKFKVHKICQTIIDWKGIEDEDGTVLECNDKTKETVYLANPEFIDKVIDKAEQLYKAVQDDLEKEAKNLKSVQDGTGTSK